MGRRRSKRLAFTAIETAVVMGIISILIALTLPAVQAAREGSRRARCQNNLRQIGVALHAYHEANNCFPVNSVGHNNGPHQAHWFGFYSMQSRLLPFLDQKPLYDSINFAVGAVPPEYARIFSPLSSLRHVNETASGTGLSVFLCPSDAGAYAGSGNNYRANIGVGPSAHTTSEHPDSGNGLFAGIGLSRDAQVPDGLSHTVAFSERLRGSGQADPDAPVAPDRDFWAIPTFVRTGDDVVLACQISARVGKPARLVSGGQSWFWSGREHTYYNHAQVPNGMVPDCLTSGIITADGMASARSRHRGGVNILMGDGSLRFTSETISQTVWRALGTRNGGEVID